jgi:hypothetical protein
MYIYRQRYRQTQKKRERKKEKERERKRKKRKRKREISTLRNLLLLLDIHDTFGTATFVHILADLFGLSYMLGGLIYMYLSDY